MLSKEKKVAILRATSQGNEHSILSHVLDSVQMSPAAVHSSHRRGRENQAASPQEAHLPHSTPGECTLAPFGPGPGFPLLQAREGIYRPRGIQTSVLQSTDLLNFLERKQTEPLSRPVPSRHPQMQPLCYGPSPQPIWVQGVKRKQILQCLAPRTTHICDGAFSFLREAASP